MNFDEQNQSYQDNRYTSFLRMRASAETREALQEFQYALEAGIINLPQAPVEPSNVSGGVNYCPNSDFKFSKLAATVLSTLPGDAGDENQECYKFFRQLATDDVVMDAAHALKAVGHSLYAANEGANSALPVWDRVNGQLKFGGSADPLYDVAVHLYNNDVKPGDVWYASFVLGALDDLPVPLDLEMYCGIWIKTASFEGWAEGGNFLASYKIEGVRGTAQYNYLIVAKTDSGDTLFSQPIVVTDAPNVIDSANFVRLSYGSALSSGFIQFEIYRQNVATNEFRRIADIRNTNQFIFDDIPNPNNELPVQSFPAVTNEVTRAYASSRGLDVGANGGSLLTNSFTLAIPVDYNISETLPFSQWFRFGFLRPVASNRQIRLDKIYLGPTYNRWSDSPFDPAGAQASTSQTGGTPITPGGGLPPDPGGGGAPCIWFGVPVLRLNFEGEQEFVPYRETKIGDPLEIGRDNPNIVKRKNVGKARLLYRIEFTNGSWIVCNLAHGICLDKGKKRATSAERIKEGARVWGWNKGREGYTRVAKKTLILLKTPVDVGTFSTTGDNSYVCGFSRDGISGVFCPNVKPVEQYQS